MSDNTQRRSTSGGDTIRDESEGTDPTSAIETKIQSFKALVGRAGVDDGTSILAVSDARSLAFLEQWRDVTSARTERLALLLDVIRGTRTGSPPSFIDDAIDTRFNPKQLAGLQWWLRADMGVTTSSGLVTNWSDQSGIGDANRHLAQATSTSQYDYTASDSAYGNQPSLSVITNTAGAWMQAAGLWSAGFSPGTFTIYWCGSQGAGTARYFLAGDTGDPHALIALQNAGGANWAYQNTANVNTSTAASAKLICCVTEANTGAAGSGNFYITDSQTAVASGATGLGNSLTGRLNVGSYTTAGGTPPAATNWTLGSLTEVILYTTVHDAATRQRVMQYLGARYGLAAT